LIDYNDCHEQSSFIKNTVDTVYLGENAALKNILVQESKSNGHFYKYIKGSLENNSNYENYILSSGLKLNKIEIEINLNKDNSRCSIYAALNLLEDQHQEIKTRINHNSPNCKSYQKIKNVLNDESKGVYQGKIFVEKIAQKTDAYQLSKALIVSDNAEFDAKPELEIYADDVKCSHGSTSGSIDSDAVHYLMTRGIPKKDAVKLLINGFLNETSGRCFFEIPFYQTDFDAEVIQSLDCRLETLGVPSLCFDDFDSIREALFKVISRYAEKDYKDFSWS
jgi:Fe-S cluster assembly protein SufD